jgi:type II restriction/modification system DNA methylase subunit YeeA
MGTSKKGPFDVPGHLARQWLDAPINPNGRPNSDVVKRWYNGRALNARWPDRWIIDFGARMPEEEASLYEAPFEYVRHEVKPIRDENNRTAYRERWWLHAEPRPALRNALVGKRRYVATTIHAKYRLFSWLGADVLPDQALIAFARDDDYFFGVLHSRIHELWALRTGTFLGVGNDPRYTPTTCFETFPLPWPPAEEPAGDDRVEAIAEAARRLDELRRNWLDPEGLRGRI